MRAGSLPGKWLGLLGDLPEPSPLLWLVCQGGMSRSGLMALSVGMAGRRRLVPACLESAVEQRKSHMQTYRALVLSMLQCVTSPVWVT